MAVYTLRITGPDGKVMAKSILDKDVRGGIEDATPLEILGQVTVALDGKETRFVVGTVLEIFDHNNEVVGRLTKIARDDYHIEAFTESDHALMARLALEEENDSN